MPNNLSRDGFRHPPTTRYTLQPAWYVYSNHNEYLGTVRRETSGGSTRYHPERKDGQPVHPPPQVNRSLGWYDKDSAAAALVNSYR